MATSFEQQLSLLEAHLTEANKIATGLRKATPDVSTSGTPSGEGLPASEKARVRVSYRTKIYRKTKLRK